MPNLTISVPHQLSRAEARRRIQEQAALLERQYGDVVEDVDRRWEGDTLHFRLSVVDQPVSGQASVEDRAATVEVALPWTLSLLAGEVRREIEWQGRQLLGDR